MIGGDGDDPNFSQGLNPHRDEELKRGRDAAARFDAGGDTIKARRLESAALTMQNALRSSIVLPLANPTVRTQVGDSSTPMEIVDGSYPDDSEQVSLGSWTGGYTARRSSNTWVEVEVLRAKANTDPVQRSRVVMNNNAVENDWTQWGYPAATAAHAADYFNDPYRPSRAEPRVVHAPLFTTTNRPRQLHEYERRRLHDSDYNF